MKQHVGLSAPPHGHHQCVHGQCGILISLHGPTDGASREEVENDRDVEPTYRGPDMGEDGQPLLVWPVGLEFLVEVVVGDERPIVVVLRLATALGLARKALLRISRSIR